MRRTPRPEARSVASLLTPLSPRPRSRAHLEPYSARFRRQCLLSRGSEKLFLPGRRALFEEGPQSLLPFVARPPLGGPREQVLLVARLEHQTLRLADGG